MGRKQAATVTFPRRDRCTASALRRLSGWFRGLSRGGWIAVGLVIGLVVAPGAAIAAATVVQIVGTNGVTKAQVTPANQLQTAEAAPSSFVEHSGLLSTPGNCTAIATAPANKGLVLKDLYVNIYDNPSPGPGQFFTLNKGSTCTTGYVVSINAGSVNGFSVPLGPGFALKAGASLYAETSGSVKAGYYLYGYTVPAGDVPATTSVINP
jgi:hypothetical protein